MTTEREMRDRVAEARRDHDYTAMGIPVPQAWDRINQAQRDFWLERADALIADLASLNLAIVEKDDTHG